MSTNSWIRVSASKRCPICQKTDWCLLTRDGTAVIGARTESRRRVWRALVARIPNK